MHGAQGMYAMNSRIDAAVAKLETKALSPDRRSSSLLSRQNTLNRQSTLTRALSGMKPPAEAPSGPKLQRLYTIDQDAFSLTCHSWSRCATAHAPPAEPVSCGISSVVADFCGGMNRKLAGPCFGGCTQ